MRRNTVLLGLRDRLPQLDAPDSDPFRALPAGAKFKPSIALFGREVIWKSSLTTSAKPDGVGAASRSWIAKGEQSGLLTHIATTGGGSLSTRMKSGVRFWNWKGRFVSTY
jgi:hypothetical protein